MIPSAVSFTFVFISIQMSSAAAAAAEERLAIPTNAQKGLICWRGVTVQRGRDIDEERETAECRAEQKHCGRSRCTFGGLHFTEQRTYKDCVSSCADLRSKCEQNSGTYLECNLCAGEKCNFEDYPGNVVGLMHENGAAGQSEAALPLGPNSGTKNGSNSTDREPHGERAAAGVAGGKNAFASSSSPYGGTIFGGIIGLFFIVFVTFNLP